MTHSATSPSTAKHDLAAIDAMEREGADTRMVRQVNPFGFSQASLGGHSARSMMWLEMRTLVRALPLTLVKDQSTKAIVEENVLDKPTLSSTFALFAVEKGGLSWCNSGRRL
jgi:hypothetical protein